MVCSGAIGALGLAESECCQAAGATRATELRRAERGGGDRRSEGGESTSGIYAIIRAR